MRNMRNFEKLLYQTFEDTKTVIRSRKLWHDRQCNGQKNIDKKDKEWSTKHFTGNQRLKNTKNDLNKQIYSLKSKNLSRK